MSKETSQIGTQGQHSYIESLVKRSGLGSIDEAIGIAFADRPTTLGKAEASTLIAALERRVGTAHGEPRPTVASGSAAQLRKLASSSTPLAKIASLDARWVVDRLRKFDAIEQVLNAGKNQNANGPISMDLLVAYFNGWDKLAEAFDVTVPTAKAWGTHLPASRAFEAQIKTGGLVYAPTNF